MKTQSPLYANALALAMLFGANAVQANPSNEDEASLGAAAIVVLAQKCSPQQASHFHTAAQHHLGYMIQRFSMQAKARIFDDMRLKIKALELSAGADSCKAATRLHAMATQWGYVHLLQTMDGR